MAHFAQLDDNDTVLTVIVIADTDCLDGPNESEAVGISFCQSLYGTDTRWLQTSYNGNIRGKYASIGGKYYSVKDVFEDADDIAAAGG